MKRAMLRAGLCVGALVLVGVGLTADPASAATYPRCNGAAWQLGDDGVTYIYTPTANGNWGCTMRYGEAGEEVRALQRTLNTCYGASLSVDGQFGSRTRAALRAAESTEGTTVDGIYSATSDHWNNDAWRFDHYGIRDTSNGNPGVRCDQIEDGDPYFP
jgi:peptidoglycan hydrolase-like protein with peptidoglycan-binding domain